MSLPGKPSDTPSIPIFVIYIKCRLKGFLIGIHLPDPTCKYHDDINAPTSSGRRNDIAYETLPHLCGGKGTNSCEKQSGYVSTPSESSIADISAFSDYLTGRY